MLRKIFGPQGDEVAEVSRRLHILKVCDFSANIMQVVKARRKRWMGHVRCFGGKRGFGGET
jgi:hypothetical protein